MIRLPQPPISVVRPPPSAQSTIVPITASTPDDHNG